MTTGLGIVGRFHSEKQIRTSAYFVAKDLVLDMDWEVLARQIMIVPNDGKAIGAALMGRAAA